MMKQVALRLPDEMHAELVAWANREERSLHAQILYVLRQALEAQRPDEPRGSL
jgi:hypothetical protein